MSSKDLQTRENQKAQYVKMTQARTQVLLNDGFSEAAIAKDSQIKHFRAKLRQIGTAVERISFLQDQTSKLEEKKRQRLAEAEAARAAQIAGETKKQEKKAVEEKKPVTGKKKPTAPGKATAQGKSQQKKK